MHDNNKRLSRREILSALTAAASAAAVAACGSSSPTAPSTSTGSNTTGTTSGGTSSGTCSVIPSETEGPYPDRTGMINNSAFYRHDITEGNPGTPLAVAIERGVIDHPGA